MGDEHVMQQDEPDRAEFPLSAASSDTGAPPSSDPDPVPPEPRTDLRFWLKIIALIVLTMIGAAFLGAIMGVAGVIFLIALPFIVDYWSDKAHSALS